MSKLSKRFPKTTTKRTATPEICELDQTLCRFHEDAHRSRQLMTRDEEAESLDVVKYIVANCTPGLSLTQWICVLGCLVFNTYRIYPAGIDTQPAFLQAATTAGLPA